MNKYYKLDSRKLTYGEYWNILHSWKVIIPWTAKLLHLPMNFGMALPYFESVRDLEVPEQEFSVRARERLQPLLDQSQHLGFHSPRFFSYGSLHGDTRTSLIALLHPSGATVRLMYTVVSKVQPPKEKLLVVLLSELRDGTFFFTSSQRKQFLSMPNIMANRLIGASPERLLESHLKILSELPMNNPPKPVTSAEMLNELWDRYETQSREFGMQRGIYVWMTPEEAAKEETGLAEAKAMSGGSDQNVDVLLEVNRLRNKKSGWGSIIVVFLISLGLFVLAGKRQWKWDYLVILLGVLFVHELGHYVAMRAFRYQNVRMFFIPFFGAAVSGQHYNVAGWKKVVVSLMGPLPGIALGVILGVAGMVAHEPVLLKIAIVSLLLNGSNLLPVLPLDGGWVFHTLLFSRHYILDIIFRVVAAIMLILSPVFLKTSVLSYVGILMLFGVKAVYRTACITTDLKKQGLPPVGEDEQNIPPETAQAIIAEVKKGATGPSSTKLVAQQTLQIFETLNARPPGWAATLGLLFVHAAGLGVAAVFALAFIFAQRGDFRDLINNASTMPKHALASGPWPVWNGNSLATNAIVVVATYARPASAAALFQDLTNHLPATASLKLFGESVLLSLPADQDDLRKQWLADFQGRTKDVFVDSTNYHAAFSLFCIAPGTNAAESIVSELNGYFNTLPDQALIPPWLPEDARPAAERARNDLARQTYLKLESAQIEEFDNPELRALEKKLVTARVQGDTSAATQLGEQLKTTTENLAKQNLERVRDGSAGLVDTNVVDLFMALNARGTATNQTVHQEIRRELALRMGQLPFVNGSVRSADERLAARYGMAKRTGLMVNVTFVSFNSLMDGPPALAGWLGEKQCIGFKYDFQPGMGTDGEGSD